MVVQPDGKVVIAGQCKNGSFLYFCISRFKADLSNYDDTFDSTTNANGRILFFVGPRNDLATRLAIQPDGKLLIAGICESNTAGTTADWCIARLNENGTFDSSFTGPAGTSNGRFMLSIGTTGIPRLNDMKLLPDGRILLVGSCMEGVARRICAAQLTTSGAFDTTFHWSGAVGGKWTDGFDGPLSGDREANAATLLPNGTTMLGASCNGNSFCVLRVAAAGAASVTIAPILNNADYPTSAAVDTSGKVVVGGYCESGAGALSFCFARYNNDSLLLDSEFDGPSGTGNGTFALTMTSNDQLQQVLALGDGRLLAIGSCRNLADTGQVACVALLNPDGSFDRNFGNGNNGWQRYDFGGSYSPSSLRSAAIMPDGRIGLAGTCGSGANADACFFRIEGWPAQAGSCRADIDGDGVVQGTRDALILSRVAMGMSGSAVLNGITFASNATRTTWPTIRDYLILRCGMRLTP